MSTLGVFLNHYSPLSDCGTAYHHLSGIQGMRGALTSDARGADCGQPSQLDLNTWEATAAADTHLNQWDCPNDLSEVTGGKMGQILQRRNVTRFPWHSFKLDVFDMFLCRSHDGYGVIIRSQDLQLWHGPVCLHLSQLIRLTTRWRRKACCVLVCLSEMSLINYH